MSRQLAKLGDKTTSGGQIISATSDCSDNGVSLVLTGDMALCPKCKGSFQIMGTAVHWSSMGKSHVATGDRVLCQCPNNQVIGNTTCSVEDLPKESHVTSERQNSASPTPPAQQVPVKQPPSPVFAKSSLRGTGCTDAGEQQEPHTNFAEMGIFQARPPAATDDEVPQHAQTAKKKPTAPEDIPKKRSSLYRWLNGNHEEIQYQAAVAAAATATRAQAATTGASVLEQIAGRFATYGTWAIRGAVTTGEVAAGGLGAPVAGLLVGMMPGRLNDGEQDFIDRMRAEQMQEAPSRVRFTWENNAQGKPVPHGWHTPPGKDMVRVRRMKWDARQQAYTFTTEEANPVTIIWTPDSSGVNTPSNTGNQAAPVMPNPVIVDPLPDNTRITATTSPAPEEKSFADYILILPVPDLPPIYIYLSKPPVEFLEVELYSDFKRRSRQGKYEADHMPSAAAVREYLRRVDPYASKAQLDEMAQDVAAIVVPKEIHQKLSETYGGRNTPVQVDLDSRNLRAAVDRNLDAIKPALKDHGATENQIETARAKLHKLNSEMGLYK